MDHERTVRLTGDETVALPGEPTVAMAGGDPTVRLAGGDPTVALTGEATVRMVGGDPTVRMVGGEPTVRVSGDPTVARATAQAAEPTTAQAQAAARGTRYVSGRAGDTRVEEQPPPAEVRFGPGVPAQPAAPAWRPATPARPRRSAWRLVSSILSGLLTVALLVAVGLYLWQRLSPLEITSVAVAVPEDPGDRCDVTIDVVATVQTNGNAGTIRYQWLRSGREPTALLTERVGRGQRTVTLHLKWAFSGVGTATETATVNITEPSPVQAQTPVTYRCEQG